MLAVLALALLLLWCEKHGTFESLALAVPGGNPLFPFCSFQVVVIFAALVYTFHQSRSSHFSRLSALWLLMALLASKAIKS